VGGVNPGVIGTPIMSTYSLYWYTGKKIDALTGVIAQLHKKVSLLLVRAEK
jgi:hypothetical protein